ncbi:LysR family transcriptional regulator [Rubritalea tangerina]|uniref:LysR family transcriptional regulator n=1 Tax=Rubritalea tangerina TaxID=430798 RepID=A0ABW4ZBQ3_9BACT
MQIRQLRYFLKVAELGSITAAAKALRMTQPALSRQIRAFEDDCGWHLINRGAKSIQLTREGQIVEREGIHLIEEVERRLATMQREIDGGIIRIGYAPSLGGKLLKKAMSCFVQRHPSVKVDLLDSTSEEMKEKILNGKIDLMVGAYAPEKGIDWEVLLEKKLFLATPQQHPLANAPVATPELLDGQRILLLSRHDYPEYYRGVLSYFKQNQINAKVAGEFDGIESLRVALEAGIGIALVAEGANVGSEVTLLPLHPSPSPVRVAVAWHNDRSLDTITASFVEELTQAAQT